MSGSKVQNYIESITLSLDSIIKVVEELSEDVIRWKPSEEEWSILQNLAHINEATVYWLGEMETVLKTPGSEWGRGLHHPERLAAVSKPDNLKIDEEVAKMKGLKDEIKNRLSIISENRLIEENPHRNFNKFGNQPISFLVEHFLVEHIEGHYGQIKRNLSKLRNDNIQ